MSQIANSLKDLYQENIALKIVLAVMFVAIVVLIYGNLKLSGTL